MKTLSGLMAGTALLIASGANAQSSYSSPAGSISADGYYINGYLDWSYFDDGGSTEDFGRVDLDMGILPSVGISGVPIGFSLGIDAFSAFGDDEVALYPAVTYALGNGLISVGVPRTVYDKGYIPRYDFGGSSAIDLELKLAPVVGPILASFYLQGFDAPYGLRYDGEFGNTKVGASYHRLEDGGINADIFSVAFQREIGALSSFYDMLFFGGIEHFTEGGIDATAYTLGAEGGVNKLHTGIVLEHSDFPGNKIDTANLYVDYKITDAFSVNATAAHFSPPGSSANIFGVGLEYRFLNNGYLRAKYIDSNNFFTDELYEISVGWKF